MGANFELVEKLRNILLRWARWEFSMAKLRWSNPHIVIITGVAKYLDSLDPSEPVSP